MATLREGLRLAQRLASQPAFESVLGDEAWPRRDLESDAQLDEYIRSTVHSANALAGTCKMGAASDRAAVVDTALCVRGAKGHRLLYK